MKLFNKNIEDTNSKIKILGSGCKKCNTLEQNTKDALKDMNMDVSIGHVTDFSKIAQYGVMTTPALVISEKVVSYGKVLSKNEILEILEEVNLDD